MRNLKLHKKLILEKGFEPNSSPSDSNESCFEAVKEQKESQCSTSIPLAVCIDSDTGMVYAFTSQKILVSIDPQTQKVSFYRFLYG